MDYESLHSQLVKIEQSQLAKHEVQNDPLSVALRFSDKRDQEAVAFLSSAFSYGNVKQILFTIEKLLKILGPAPYKTLLNTSGPRWEKIIPREFKHRFNTSRDLGILLTWTGEALRKSGNLEMFFLGSSALSSPLTALPTLDILLEDFIERFTSLPATPYKKPKSKGALFFFPRPSNKSGCKRLLLFLKWMAGTGPMTLGLWKNLPPEKLIIPVDTHILRISRNLGLTKRRDPSWRTAREITESLRPLSPNDPTRWDFALCHLGISQACPSKTNKKICQGCGMNTLCLNYKKEKNNLIKLHQMRRINTNSVALI